MIEKDLGFVLRRYNFRETSLITTLYTSRFGKIRGIFKGFYTFKKEFSSSLDIFTLNEFIFYPKKSEIWLISHADLVSDFSYLREDLPKAKVVAIMLNLLDKTMLLWDRNLEIFNLINDCLNCLRQESEVKILYVFLIKFLSLAGFKPEFNHCLICQKSLDDEFYFSVTKGGLVCKACGRGLGDLKKITKQTCRSLLYIQNSDFALIGRLKVARLCEEEFFYILGRFLAYHFEFDGLIKSNFFPVSLQLASQY
ncbi:MAG: DNA repair protein RecO [Candidatus Susulua stagnicola]|nr:DNA repair protein RecO [Candidatus Susulua stagnicola]